MAMSDSGFDPYSGELDPEIASLLGPDAPIGPSRAVPDFEALMGDRNNRKEQREEKNAPGEKVDISIKTFNPVTNFKEDPPLRHFDAEYYKTAMKNEGDNAKKVHNLLASFLNATDPETKSSARLKLVPTYWEMLNSMVLGLSPSMPLPKRLCIRFGALLPTMITPEQREIIGSIIMDNRLAEPIHYMDDWLKKVGSGEAAPLATDEEFRPNQKSDGNNALIQKLEHVRGKKAAHESLISSRIAEMKNLERSLSTVSDQLQHHDRHPTIREMDGPYNPQQRQAITNSQENLKRLLQLDREIQSFYEELEKHNEDVKQLEIKCREAGANSTVDSKAVVKELQSMRQMCKMSAGRQGNHFPVLYKNYMPHRIEEIGTRENTLTTMSQVERLDPGLFLRAYKGSFNRIVPHVILLPSYGDFGLCWEPFEKFNRSTSRGRIAVPMFSKNVRLATIYALADFRWQVAKEKASYRWMEEGLTGWYYTWFSEKKLKGDVRLYFIQDYITWITKESEGTQKLDKEIRGIFWRNMPFPQDVKDTLKNRGFVYNELYKKDLNRAMSDGY